MVDRGSGAVVPGAAPAQSPLPSGGPGGGVAAAVDHGASQDVVGALAALEAAVDGLGRLDLTAADAAALARLHDGLRAAGDRVAVVRARVLARIEADGAWAVSGRARTLPQWVAGRGGASVGTARREVALGRALEQDLPGARAAVAAGEISVEHAQVLTEIATSSPARRAALASDRPDRNEAFLLDAARRTDVDRFRRIVRRWAGAVDTAAAEVEHREAVAREHLRLVRRRDGVDVTGFLAAENAEILATALRVVTGVPADDDQRSREQRDAAALTGLAKAVLDHGLAGAGTALVRPHLLVHVPYETFTALAAGATEDGLPLDLPPVLETATGALGAPAELDDGTPIPGSVLARLACDSRITRIVFGPEGQPLDVGRAQRTFTGPQRAAVVARDRHCAYPGCSAPPALCEVHHIRWWSRGGETSVANGILLCAYHHHLVHRRDVAITRHAGRFRFRTREGAEITAPRDGTTSAGPPGSGTTGRGAPAGGGSAGEGPGGGGPGGAGAGGGSGTAGPPGRPVGSTRPAGRPSGGTGRRAGARTAEAAGARAPEAARGQDALL